MNAFDLIDEIDWLISECRGGLTLEDEHYQVIKLAGLDFNNPSLTKKTAIDLISMLKTRREKIR